jgi:curved DNA-binding protein CbpA
VPTAPVGSTPPRISVPAAPRTTTPASRISTPVSRSTTPPSSDPEGFKRDLRERAAQIPSQNYYQILGVAEDAAPSAIQVAFFQLAKRWHPDRLGPEHADVRDIATRVFARMSEAHNMLADAQKRREYDELLKGGGGTAQEQEEIQAVLRAAMNFRKAEVLLKKNNLGAAEEHAALAVQDDPKQAEYVALHTWITSMKPDRLGLALDDLIAKLNQCVSLEPNNLRIRWYRGQMYKRNGKDKLAIRDFRFIADQDENHLDATREIRLYEMRRAGRPSSAPPPGQSVRPGDSRAPQSGGRGSDVKRSDIGQLFGKLFKR